MPLIPDLFAAGRELMQENAAVHAFATGATVSPGDDTDDCRHDVAIDRP